MERTSSPFHGRRHACVRPVAATAANLWRWSTPARHRHRLRRPVGSRSASSMCVHWQKSRWYARATTWSPYRCHVPRWNVARHRLCRFSTFELCRLPSGRSSTPATQSWTWIGSIHGLDWIGLGQDYEETLWIGLGPMNAILCFFRLYIFYINNWQTLSLCILADFNYLWLDCEFYKTLRHYA